MIPTGSRIFDVKHLFEQLASLDHHKPFDCGFSHMEFRKESKFGLKSVFHFKCKMCELETKLSTHPAEASKINATAVIGSLTTGVGFSQCEQMFAHLNIPFMAANTYREKHQEVSDVILDTT